MNENWNTQQTLIQRAQNQDDHQAWDDFVTYYESFIKMVLRKANISLNDEDDRLLKTEGNREAILSLESNFIKLNKNYHVESKFWHLEVNKLKNEIQY